MQKMSVAELLGTAQQHVHSGRPELAAALYREWLDRPDEGSLRQAVCFNYGVVLTSLKDLHGAVAAFQEAIRCDPAFLPPYINLGSIFERLGAPDQALALWCHVNASLAGVTGDTVIYKTTALKQTAQLLEGRKMLPAAEEALRQILELRQHQRDVVQHWISLRQRQCKWPLLERVGGLGKRELVRDMAPLSLAIYTDDPLLQLAGAARQCREEPDQPAIHDLTDAVAVSEPGRTRLRIGYLSSDLRNHAIGYLMCDMFRYHDREKVEIFIYYTGIAAEDLTKQRIRDHVEHWRDITELADEDALQLIRGDRIAILVDVNGHTRSARSCLLARRPAPVIVNWLGYPGSMGSPYHHYIIADDVIVPDHFEIYYTEKVLRLSCYQPNDRHRVVADTTPTRTEVGLPDDGVVFCNFNGAQKITRFVFARWMSILRQVPDSVLWLLKGTDDVEERLRELAAAAAVSPDRLVFAPMIDNAQHLARYRLADLFLDTFPYGAHTTASDALWMGVPVLTLPGRSFASRVCASLVRAAGIPELICASAADFLAQAVVLGRDRSRLLAHRQKLLAGRDSCSLFDTQRLVRELEALFEAMWADAAADRLPRPDLTNLDAYLEVGAELDHESVEFHDLPAYVGRYLRALAAPRACAHLPGDRRLLLPQVPGHAESLGVAA